METRQFRPAEIVKKLRHV